MTQMPFYAVESTEMYTFTGQTALVTGATRGIGRAISLAFLRNGARVIGIFGGNTASAEAFSQEARDFQDRLFLFQCDIANQQAVEELYGKITADFSSIDILVNNAGVRRDAILPMMHDEDWHKVIDVNLTGTYLMTKPAVLMMMAKKFGRIITVTSPASHLGFTGQCNYSASKAGQIGFSRSLAKETARKGITVNCVSPGFIATDFIDDLSEDLQKEYKKMIPMRRFGKPEEVAETVLFLASRQASYISGSVVEITGGL